MPNEPSSRDTMPGRIAGPLPSGERPPADPTRQPAPGNASPDASPLFHILACSPRRNGNSDSAAALLRQSLGGMDGKVIRVADAAVRPCLSCGWCDGHPGQCTLSGRAVCAFPSENAAPAGDQALDLLREAGKASVACVVSPVYFYHLPAQAKALVDRAQAFWSVPEKDKPGQGRPLHVVLLGARPRGEKLFTGALLTLRYMAQALGLVLAEPLLLYGLDDARALARDREAQKRLIAYGHDMAARAVPGWPAGAAGSARPGVGTPHAGDPTALPGPSPENPA